MLFLHEINTCLAEQNNDIDYVFCFIQNSHLHKEELAEWIKAALLYCQVSAEKIIDAARIYNSLYPKERYRRLLENPEVETLDGPVFGISLGMFGIHSSYLPGNVLNFA